MKRMSVVLSCLLVLALCLPMVAVAQDDELPEGWEEFISEEETLYIAFPEGYYAGIKGESEIALAVANSEELLERLTNEDDEDDGAVSGDQAIQFTILPLELLSMMATSLSEEPTAEELLMGFNQMVQMPTVAEPWEFGEIEVGEDEEGQEFGFQPFTLETESIEGYIIATRQDEIVLYAVVAAYTGEFSDEWFDTGLSILETLTIDITADDLFDMWMGTFDDSE